MATTTTTTTTTMNFEPTITTTMPSNSLLLRSSSVLRPRLGSNTVVAAPPPVDLWRTLEAEDDNVDDDNNAGNNNNNSSSNNNNNNSNSSNSNIDDDSVSFYDLYQSPCRGILRASNDELLDFVDLREMNDDGRRNHIVSYNSASSGSGGSSTTTATMASQLQESLYQDYYYYYDDMEYCGSTFYGGCRFPTQTALTDAIAREEEEEEYRSRAANDDDDEASPPSPPQSFVNWTVVYDYEVHYIDSYRSRSSTSTSTPLPGSESTAMRHSNYREQQEQHRGDPIPAINHLETIVLEHLGEVVGLSRKECSNSNNNKHRNSNSSSYHHDFSDDQLERLMAISSDPGDVLDPDHANCIVPVSSAIGQTTDCMPVTGAIRIYLNTTGIEEEGTTLEETKLSIQSGFQRLIRFGMRQGLYLSEETEDTGDDDGIEQPAVVVKHVSFIGTRVFAPGGITSNDDKDNENENDDTLFGGTSDQDIEVEIAIGNHNNPIHNLRPSPSASSASSTEEASGNGPLGGNKRNLATLVVGSLGAVVLAVYVALRSASSSASASMEPQADETCDVEHGACRNDESQPASTESLEATPVADGVPSTATRDDDDAADASSKHENGGNATDSLPLEAASS